MRSDKFSVVCCTKQEWAKREVVGGEGAEAAAELLNVQINCRITRGDNKAKTVCAHQ